MPSAIAADSAGNIWVANSGNNSVTEIPNGSTSCSTGCNSFTGGGIHSPLSITADPSGNVWVVNKEETGINKIKTKPANNPRLTVSNSKLYATWEESNDTSTQIRMAVYNGNDIAPSWTFIDGNGTNGLNVDPLRFARYPQLVDFASNLYATWQEFNGAATQIRLALYNGNDAAPSWTFMNGSGIGGLNHDVLDSADHPELTVFNSKLYVSWDEYYSVSHIRVAVIP